MAMQNSVKKVPYGNTEADFLVGPDIALAYSCIVGNSGLEANADGRKIIKKGSPLFASVDPLTNRQTVLRAVGDSTYKYVAGIARHNIDVTEGDANDAVLYSGCVDLYRLDSDVQTAIATALEAGGYEPTKGFRIVFIKGAK